MPTAKDFSHVQTRQSGAQLAAPQIVDARDGVYAAILEASPSACFLFTIPGHLESQCNAAFVLADA